MQNDQHADAQIAHEPVPAPCATPPKKRGQLVAFFAKMYSPHGTLTCKEFIWPAVYLLTLGKILDGLLIVPLEVINITSPLKDAAFLGKAFAILYAAVTNIIFLLYPQFTLCKKLLKNTIFSSRHIGIALFIILVFISFHMFIFERGSFLYYYSGYILSIILMLCVYIIGKKFSNKKMTSTYYSKTSY